MDPSVVLESDSRRENVFSRSSTQRNEVDDEEALKWAALQKLPTYDRIRTVIMKNVGADGKVSQEEVDVRNLSHEDRQQIISKLLRVTEEDNERFLLKFRERIDRSEIPQILLMWSQVTSSLELIWTCNNLLFGIVVASLEKLLQGIIFKRCEILTKLNLSPS